jgi:hypothetical protein
LISQSRGLGDVYKRQILLYGIKVCSANLSNCGAT